MADYYLKGEEKFGPITSRIYSLFASRIHDILKFYEFVVSDISSSKAKALLDIGTGPGEIPIRLARMNRFEVYAVDPSPAMLSIARGNSTGLKRVHFALGSSRSIPFKIKFDMIISSLSMHHWKEKEESLRYLSKFLSKNGEIRIYEFEREAPKSGPIGAIKGTVVGHHSLSLKEFKHIAYGSGLKVRSVHRANGFIRVTYAQS
ncbi:MAG: class I SAM-dependent methyltransferase [Candidatus Micrarchaeales archaeon]|jgi:Methylase involved in ubiquinone/menaquinone biosynthesis|uniref:Methyltransferase type 11 n=1 Tax=Candidatus Micrarchaeum acidiphilum ARMAN-2 TaxID=425595 RepID=C7DIG1_MICA2|nr:MAG: Methyltransferase type 11 [Candidatus Micrarchaeum acidiphilum ARMAN-2]MCW6160989.1 class I SAM-dependent methyltransferase [Candidatus Micrarchaeales archaeon]